MAKSKQSKNKTKRKPILPKLTLNDVYIMQHDGLFLEIGKEVELGNKFASQVLRCYVEFNKAQNSSLAEYNFLMSIEIYLREKKRRDNLVPFYTLSKKEGN